MSDDWRLKVALVDDGAARALTERLSAEKLGEDLESSFGDRVVVSGEGADVFVYADAREQADAAADVIRGLATKHEWDVELELKRWHPTAEEWEDPDVPLPQSDAERAAEHAQRVAKEREETSERGYAEYEEQCTFTSYSA